MKITKKIIAENTSKSIDGFGKNYELQIPGLIATRFGNDPEVEIFFNFKDGQKKKIAQMHGSSKKEFVDVVYDYIN